MHQSLPEQLGKYQVRSLLGQGAMGIVYQCFDPDIQRNVAIKLVHSHLQTGKTGQESSERFRQEARAAARCQHPNIVTIYELGRHHDSDFIVMEFIQGEELRYFLEAGQQFTTAECLFIAIEVLAALEHAHRQGVIHRDIKPANIILLDNGGIKVADFGVARLEHSELTLAGNMVGTPTYMAPEGLRGERVDSRADLYSVGMVLLEMLTGQKPEPQQLFAQPPARFVSDALGGERGRALPESLQAILGTALAAAAEQRYESAEVFSHELQTLAAGLDDAKTAAASLSETVISQRPLLTEPLPAPVAATHWSAEVLENIEHSLAGYIGPLARILVNQSASHAGSLEDLTAQLAEKIPDAKEREEFLHQISVHTRGENRSQSLSGAAATVNPEPNPYSAATIAARLDTDQKTTLIKLLSYYIGPLAGKLVELQAGKHRETAAFLSALCDSIPSEQDRSEFRSRLPDLRL